MERSLSSRRFMTICRSRRISWGEATTVKRSYKLITKEDLRRLARIAKRDCNRFIRRNPHRAYLAKNVLCVALCQGAALHYVGGKNGIKDFDVWTFYGGRGRPYPARVRRSEDFGIAKFGRATDCPSF